MNETIEGMTAKRSMERILEAGKRVAVTLAVLMAISMATGALAQSSPNATNVEKRPMTAQGKFYCNTKALTPAEREQHKLLSEKLVAARTETVETAKGYEFQFRPASVSLAELADWVAAESKCCPFFDFHIDLENEGKLICLRLTGEEGIKAFIRTELGVKER